MSLSKYYGVSEDRLYKLAVACAKYNDQGCSGDCAGCQFNVFNYVKDVREASLLKANAYTNYYTRKASTKQYEHDQKIRNGTSSFMGFLMIGFIVFCIVKCNTGLKNAIKNVPASKSVSSKVYVPTPTHPKIQTVTTIPTQQQAIDPIKNVLKQMVQVGIRDINNDGLLNCIDYSVLFVQLYKNDAQLYINYNPPKMNHMFVKTGSKAIEPQAATMPGESYLMKEYWGDIYDPIYDRLATDYFYLLKDNSK